MAEITENGYLVKTQNEWFEEELARYKDIDPNWNTDPSTPDGIKIATDSEIWSSESIISKAVWSSGFKITPSVVKLTSRTIIKQVRPIDSIFIF